MIIYNKTTKQLLDSTTVSDFDIVLFERDPDYNYIKPTPQQEADYILQQSQLQLANNKTIAINQLQTLKTNAIDKLRADNFANIIKTILTQNQSAIDNIIAVDIKLDNINTVLAESITQINEAINQSTIDNAVATFTAIL
jgi:DNA repair ATPase RecN